MGGDKSPLEGRVYVKEETRKSREDCGPDRVYVVLL